MDLILRPADPADLEPLVGIAHQGFWDAHPFLAVRLGPSRTRHYFRAQLSERLRQTTVAEVDGCVAALSVLRDDELVQLAVEQRFRGRGVAGALLAHAERSVAAAGHPRIWMLISEESEAVQRLCRRAGWLPTASLLVAAETVAGPLPVPCLRYERPVSARAA